jgi:hypothetical protein
LGTLNIGVSTTFWKITDGANDMIPMIYGNYNAETFTGGGNVSFYTAPCLLPASSLSSIGKVLTAYNPVSGIPAPNSSDYDIS